MNRPSLLAVTSVLALAVTLSACHRRKPPVANAPPVAPSPFPGATAPPVSTETRPPAPPPIPGDSPIRASSPTSYDDKTLDAINGPDSPLKPVFFTYDSDDLDDAARKTISANADVLKTYPKWIVTVEGHSDERGTAEYNLALGDRRSLATKNYLVSLGIAADRIRTVSYGEEFPFDAGHDERSWTSNRRAHFMLTSK